MILGITAILWLALSGCRRILFGWPIQNRVESGWNGRGVRKELPCVFISSYTCSFRGDFA
jgi:hypothetical protein